MLSHTTPGMITIWAVQGNIGTQLDDIFLKMEDDLNIFENGTSIFMKKEDDLKSFLIEDDLNTNNLTQNN
jgi:hypothetical protein